MNDPFEVFDFKDEKDWLSGRMNGIGGSDASAVVGMNPYKSNIDLFEEKTGNNVLVQEKDAFSCRKIFSGIQKEWWGEISGASGTGKDSGKGLMEIFFLLV